MVRWLHYSHQPTGECCSPYTVSTKLEITHSNEIKADRNFGGKMPFYLHSKYVTKGTQNYHNTASLE